MVRSDRIRSRIALATVLLTLMPCKSVIGAEKRKTPEAEVTSASARAELSIPGVTKKAVMDGLVEGMTEQEYTIGSVSEYKAVFERPGGFWVDLFMGSRFNSSTVWRVTYSVFEVSGSVRVKTDIGIVTNPGSGFEKVEEANQKKHHRKIQGFLNQLRDRLDAPAGRDSTESVADSLGSGFAQEGTITVLLNNGEKIAAVKVSPVGMGSVKVVAVGGEAEYYDASVIRSITGTNGEDLTSKVLDDRRSVP
jgi:hypothetical protein